MGSRGEMKVLAVVGLCVALAAAFDSEEVVTPLTDGLELEQLAGAGDTTAKIAQKANARDVAIADKAALKADQKVENAKKAAAKAKAEKANAKAAVKNDKEMVKAAIQKKKDEKVKEADAA